MVNRHKSLDIEKISTSGEIVPTVFTSGSEVLFAKRPGRTFAGLSTFSTWLDEQLQEHHHSPKNQFDDEDRRDRGYVPC